MKNETEYWRDRGAVAMWHPVEPPRWATAAPDEWEQERDRARAMSRAARAHMGELVAMFDAWAGAWDRRHRAYALLIEARNRAAVSAVVERVTPEEARVAFRQARRAEEERLALVSLTWATVGGAEHRREGKD